MNFNLFSKRVIVLGALLLILVPALAGARQLIRSTEVLNMGDGHVWTLYEYDDGSSELVCNNGASYPTNQPSNCTCQPAVCEGPNLVSRDSCTGEWTNCGVQWGACSDPNPPPPPPPTPSGCGPGTLNDQCPPPPPPGVCQPAVCEGPNLVSRNSVTNEWSSCSVSWNDPSCVQPPTTPSGCGPGTLNDQCPPPPTPSGCGPGTLNDQCQPPPPNYSQGNYYSQSYYQGSYTPTPTASLSANPGTIDAGQSTTLTWSSSNATSCTAAGGFSTGGATSGSASVSPSESSTYQVTCSGAGGSAQSSAGVTVQNPQVSISASPLRVQIGANSTISWSASQVGSCSVSGPGLTSPAASGSRSIAIQSRSIYTITCQTNTSPLTRSVTVNVVQDFQEF